MRRRVLGAPTAPSRPAPSSVFRIASAASPITLTLQGLIEDDASQSSSHWSVTNAIVLRVRVP
ncbi:MAG: hypothetical protein HYR85_20850 [Planctomycetes bacterium]|nr:hypothetical protein [Planctomycetota bacterium]MBI3844886.1 hypothetical protein [Planctomycetota bacterium]